MKKKVIISTFLVSLVVMVLCLTKVSAAGNSEVENNDTIDKSNNINLNVEITGNLSSGSDVDNYHFSLSKPGIIQIEFGHDYVDSSYEYWKTQLRNDKNDLIREWGWQGNATQSDRTCIIGLDAGEYYLSVKDANYSSNKYYFTVIYEENDKAEKEFNETVVTANNINTNTSILGSIRNSNDEDCFVFTLEEDGYIWITFDHDYVDSSYDYWKTSFINEKNNIIFEEKWQGNTLLPQDGRKCGLEAGTYYLKIEDANVSTVTYYFTVNYVKSNVWEKEFNNTVADPDAIKYNKHYNGTLRTSDDKDYYMFSIPNQGKIRIYFEHDYVNSSYNYWETGIIDESNSRLLTLKLCGNETVGQYSKELTVLPGTYYFSVQECNFSSVPYKFSIEYTTTDSFDNIVYDDEEDSEITPPSPTDVPVPTENPALPVDVGTEFSIGDLKYCVTYEDEVTVMGLQNTAATSITIPATIVYEGYEYDVVAIQKNAFKKNNTLKTVIINADLDSIGDNAFYYCKALESIELNGDIDKVNKKAFYKCKNMKTMKITALEIDFIGENAFYRIGKKATIYVPSSTVEDYKKLLKVAGLSYKVTVIGS